MEPGVYPELQNEDYHAAPGLSKSGMDLLLKSPAHYRAAKDTDHEPTPAMLMGSAVHTAVLEPDLFEKKYVPSPDINRRTKAGKEEFAAFQEANQGKEILKPEDYELIINMRDSIFAHTLASKLLTDGKAELSYFWEDDQTGALLKCRPDYLRSDGVVIDLKTTLDASPESFAKSAANFHYHLQAAHYLEGVSALGDHATHFVFVCVEKKPPYAVACYTLDSEAVGFGQLLAREAISRYTKCREADQWPGYSPKIESLSLPPWAFR